MKIRTQLVLAWLVLSILPLTVIVLYTYYSSRRAVEGAYQGEAQRLTAQMDRRLTNIRADLDQRLASLSALPLPSTPTAGETATGHSAVVDNILMAMGEAAPLVDALEYVPARPAAPKAIAQAHPEPATKSIAPTPKVATSLAPPPPPPPAASVAAANEDDDEEPRNVDVDVRIAEPIVIDLPPMRIPKFTMPPDFNKRISEITRLTIQFGQKSAQMSPEERDEMKKHLKEKQQELDATLKESQSKFDEEMKEANRAREERQKALDKAREARQRERQRDKGQHQILPQRQTQIAPSALTPAQRKAEPNKADIRPRRELTAEEKERLKTKEKQAALLFGHRFHVPVHKEGEIVGQIRAQLSTEEVVRRVLGAPTEDSSEISFAIDREGNVYTRNARDRATLERLGIPQRFKEKRPLGKIEGWIVAISWHKESGLRVGVARPLGENLEELRRTAARNFGYGIGLIAFALVGIIPLANHLTRDVKTVTDGAERIAQGDLATRLPVRSNSEFGQLAVAFNQMAEDLSKHREQEIHQRVLALEYERKSVELEDARRFQLSMLPKSVPQHPRYDLAVFTQTAAEVGGDYYDFHLAKDQTLSVTIGDATGHGAKAGTMVTVIKTLFAGYDASECPASFLGDAAEKIKRMELGRMAMALSLARFDGSRLTIASAGMPPLLVHRAADSAVEEVTLPATPLGTLGVDYPETSVSLRSGDTVLLMSDGFPELQNLAGQQLGYTNAAQEFAAAAASATAQSVIDGLAGTAKRWHGDQPPNDDITFVVVRFI